MFWSFQDSQPAVCMQNNFYGICWDQVFQAGFILRQVYENHEFPHRQSSPIIPKGESGTLVIWFLFQGLTDIYF